MGRFATGLTGSMLALCLALQPVTASAETVGKLTAEKATVTKNGGARLRAGSGIDRGDRLRANGSGSGLVVFRDESSARLGPNADLVIDEFVYNPGGRSGTIRLNQRSGTARIFGGQISKRGSSQVRTPHIVLGVRGGIIDVAVAGGQTIATLRAGIMECRVAGKKRVVTNPGISCIGDGGQLTTGRLDSTGRRFVDAAGGSGNRRGSKVTNETCASPAGQLLASCQTRDGKLPGADTGGGRTKTGGTNGVCVSPQTAGGGC